MCLCVRVGVCMSVRACVRTRARARTRGAGLRNWEGIDRMRSSSGGVRRLDRDSDRCLENCEGHSLLSRRTVPGCTSESRGGICSCHSDRLTSIVTPIQSLRKKPVVSRSLSRNRLVSTQDCVSVFLSFSLSFILLGFFF